MELYQTIQPYLNELDTDKVNRVYRLCEEEDYVYWVLSHEEDQLGKSLERVRRMVESST